MLIKIRYIRQDRNLIAKRLSTESTDDTEEGNYHRRFSPFLKRENPKKQGFDLISVTSVSSVDKMFWFKIRLYPVNPVKKDVCS